MINQSTLLLPSRAITKGRAGGQSQREPQLQFVQAPREARGIPLEKAARLEVPDHHPQQPTGGLGRLEKPCRKFVGSASGSASCWGNVAVLMDPRVQQPPPLCSNQAQACFKALQMRCFVFGEGQKCQGVAMEGGGRKSHIWWISIIRHRQYLCCHNRICPMENAASSGGLSSNLRRKKWELYWNRN